MASTMIHIAVANEINKKLNMDHQQILIGSIAPDLSKLVGENKIKSHFLIEEGDVPNLDKFLEKYKDFLNDSFVMGYYIHLYTDYLWFKYFIPEIWENSKITKLDGSIFNCTENMFKEYLYSDYTNLNVQLIDKYNLDLDIFYNGLPDIEKIITEIPIDKLNLLIDKTYEIIKKTRENKKYILDIKNVENFIQLCVDIISSSVIKKVYNL